MIRPLSWIRPLSAPRRAFSLVELLVVIGIIALLAGILFPTISKVRISAQNADSQSLLNQIDSACQAYFTDFKAYPGPLPYTQLNADDQSNYTAVATPIYYVEPQPSGATVIINGNSIATAGTSTTAAAFNATGTRVTGAENLVLGLCGGLKIDRTVTPNRYYYEESLLGSGPSSFNAIRPTKATAYLQPTNLSTVGQRLDDPRRGRIENDAGTASGVDSVIPEFMDRFATPMPFLYMRSRTLGRYDTATGTENLVSNIASTATGAPSSNDYNILEVEPYTNYATGAGSTLKPSAYAGVPFSATAPHGLQVANPARTIDKNNKITGITYQYPYDAYDYFVDPASYDRTQSSAPTAAQLAAKRVRKKDSYVLISAGKDRIYGTADDITNFGSVLP